MRCRIRTTSRRARASSRGAQRGPRGRHRRGARGRLAAARAAAGGQSASAAGHARAISRRRRSCRCSASPRASIAPKATSIRSGDPHIQTDPRNILRVAVALAARMAQLDPAERRILQRRAGALSRALAARRSRAGRREAAPLKGVPVVVQHKAFTYLIAWLGMSEVAALEPKPGMEPPPRTCRRCSQRCRASPRRWCCAPPTRTTARRSGSPSARRSTPSTLPFTVGGDDGPRTCSALFDDTIARLLQGGAVTDALDLVDPLARRSSRACW